MTRYVSHEDQSAAAPAEAVLNGRTNKSTGYRGSSRAPCAKEEARKVHAPVNDADLYIPTRSPPLYSACTPIDRLCQQGLLNRTFRPSMTANETRAKVLSLFFALYCIYSPPEPPPSNFYLFGSLRKGLGWQAPHVRLLPWSDQKKAGRDRQNITRHPSIRIEETGPQKGGKKKGGGFICLFGTSFFLWWRRVVVPAAPSSFFFSNVCQSVLFFCVLLGVTIRETSSFFAIKAFALGKRKRIFFEKERRRIEILNNTHTTENLLALALDLTFHFLLLLLEAR